MNDDTTDDISEKGLSLVQEECGVGECENQYKANKELDIFWPGKVI